MSSELVSPYRLTLGNEPVEAFDDRLQVAPELGAEPDEVGQPADCRWDTLEHVGEDHDSSFFAP